MLRYYLFSEFACFGGHYDFPFVLFGVAFLNLKTRSLLNRRSVVDAGGSVNLDGRLGLIFVGFFMVTLSRVNFENCYG